MRKQWLVLAASLLVMAMAVPAVAQKITAAIRGTVTDPTGAVVAGAKVTVKNEETGLTRTASTNSAGNYSFDQLPVGTYRIDVEQAGFKAASRSKITLNVADTRAVDVALQTGDISEQVNVEVAAVSVKTVGAEIAGVVSGEQVRELPLNGRNFMQLTLLQPGVTATEGLNTVNKGLQGGSDIAVSGGSTTSNLWLIDGADNVDHGSNRTIMVYPSVDAIEEFKIQRNNYGAEFGQAGGAQINLVTRGGTNEWHGSAYYFARRDSLNSKNYFLERANQPKAPLEWDDYGGTLGGPILKDKLHFFVSYEKNKDNRSSVRSGHVPTQAQRNGDFSVPGVNGCSGAGPINDPLTGQPFPGNRIPANRLNPAGVAFLNLYQLPNNTPASGCNNWVGAVATPINWDQINARVDWSLGNSTRVMVRYTQDSWVASNLAGGTDGVWGDSQTSVVGSDWDQPGKSLVAQLNQNIGSKMTNTLTFSYSANKISVSRSGDAAKVDAINGVVPTLFPADIKQKGGDAQGLWWWGSSGYGDLWNQSPWLNDHDIYVLKDDWSAVFGKHFVKAGFLVSSNSKNEEVNNTSQEGVNVGGSAGFITPSGFRSGLNTGNGAADVLLSGMAFNTTELRTNPNVQQRWHDYEFYIADSYKIAPRWTADFGVRLSHMQQPYMADDRMGNFIPATANPALGNAPCNGMVYPVTNPCPALGLAGGSVTDNRSLVPIKFLWFAPRLGLAWDVKGDGTMAVRAGIGRFYQRDRVSPGLGVGTNPPFSGSASIIRTLNSATVVSGNPAPAYGSASNSIEPVEANSNYWQWNVSVEKQIVRNTVVELAYVGSKGLDLFGQTNMNEVAPANRLAYARTGNAAFRPLNGIEGVGDGNVALWQHNRESIYHSLQVAANSRFGHGSHVGIAYTWSKIMANTGVGNADGPGLSNLNAYTDSTNPDLDYARGAIDRTHVFSGSLIWALPTLEEKGGFAKHVFGDWQFNAIVQTGTGYPITVVTGSVPGVSGNGNSPSGSGNGNNLTRPNRVEGQPCTLEGSDPTQYLNPAAWTLNGYVLGTNGNSGRNICDGPGFFQADASLYKNIKLGSRVKLQLRFEVFNLFNTVNLVGTSMTNGGALTAYNAQNVVFDTGSGATATRIQSAQPVGNFGQMTQARDPRTAQLGIRLTF